MVLNVFLYASISSSHCGVSPAAEREVWKNLESLQRDKDVLKALCRQIIQYHRPSKPPLDDFIIYRGIQAYTIMSCVCLPAPGVLRLLFWDIFHARGVPSRDLNPGLVSD